MNGSFEPRQQESPPRTRGLSGRSCLGSTALRWWDSWRSRVYDLFLKCSQTFCSTLFKVQSGVLSSQGDVGYLGVDGLYVLGKARRKSLDDTGLHLSYYGHWVDGNLRGGLVGLGRPRSVWLAESA